MKLPRIESQYNPRAQGSNQVAQTGLVGISQGLQKFAGVTDALFQDRMNDLEEQKRADQIVAQSKFEQSMFETKAKITQNIDTDPNYASARNRWMKESESVIGKLEAAKDADPVWKEQVMAGLRRDQISSDFQIGAAIKQRRKSEVAAAAEASIYNATQDFVLGRMTDIELSNKIGASYGSAASVGAIQGAQIKMKAQQALSSAVSMKTNLLLQEGNLAEARKLVELNKESVSPETFVNLNGVVTAQETKLDAFGKTQKYISSGGVTERPTNNQLDSAYAQTLQQSNPNTYAQTTVEFVKSTGYVPAQFKSQAQTYLTQYNEKASRADIETAVSNALIINDMPAVGKAGFSKDIVSRANLMVSRMDAGMSSSDAYQSVMRQKDDKNYQSVYTAAVKDVRKEGLVPDDIRSVSQRYDWIDAYGVAVSNGADADEAKKLATQQVTSAYGTFNGREVRFPPTKLTPYTNETSWSKAAKSLISQNGVNIPEGTQIILSGDRDTQRQVENGTPPTDLSFPVVIHDPNLDMDIPVISKTTGRVLRVKGNPILKVNTAGSDVLNTGVGQWIMH